MAQRRVTAWTCFTAVAGLLSCSRPVYDVVVVGGGPAGIGAALAAAQAGAKTVLIERDSRIGGTTVQTEVCDIGLFYAWRKQIIAGPAWEMVCDAVAEAGGTLPDFSRQEPDKVGSIPLGAMLPKGVGNLLVTGRAISSDHGANSALRVQASCMGMGQAAGVVAAVAASRRCDPREVPLDEAKACLSRIGHIVPWN